MAFAVISSLIARQEGLWEDRHAKKKDAIEIDGKHLLSEKKYSRFNVTAHDYSLVPDALFNAISTYCEASAARPTFFAKQADVQSTIIAYAERISRIVALILTAVSYLYLPKIHWWVPELITLFGIWSIEAQVIHTKLLNSIVPLVKQASLSECRVAIQLIDNAGIVNMIDRNGLNEVLPDGKTTSDQLYYGRLYHELTTKVRIEGTAR